jgi:hypothetical protein
MSADACRAAFNAAPILERASKLDKAFPKCACEPWALTKSGGDGIPNAEKLARILTTPDDYDESASTIITSRLTAIYAMGMSVIRQGATDNEIEKTVNELLSGGTMPRKLFGAAVIAAHQIRAFCNDDDTHTRWFGAYATDDKDKTHHGDIFGVMANKNQQSKRRGKLAIGMSSLIINEDTISGLIVKLRNAGI